MKTTTIITALAMTMTLAIDSFAAEFQTDTFKTKGADYVCITDIAALKNPIEPKDVVKNWMRSRATISFLGLWEKLHNPDFKGVDFDPLLAQAGDNAFTMSPTRWVEEFNSIGILCKIGRGDAIPRTADEPWQPMHFIR